MEKESKARIGEIGTAVISALVTALVMAYIAVSLCKGTLHIMAFFWSALVAGVFVSHLVRRIREIRERRNGK